ncbi:MAG: lipid-A-disaccharide synthase [Omnitrophica bacterium RIFCSPHIGHO2_02_FULL_46_11]|nr:MAG: lipid-A-disaccharide synthase [Omnitrophica bacterium RIFCSPHIGHO2_02_FULL_46_11]OGW87919.1 MAG: lipid-A-disaccharide synthase [Omnitrophica bacterium RIFCSPLOWO2_01_FULL_45_10b]
MFPKKLFLIAGEASGDFHGAHLVRELKRLHPDLECRGLGGALMAQEGVHLICDLTKDAVLGLGDVLRKYFFFRSIFNQALDAARRFKPDAIILIDYPGFNLRFAKKINKEFRVIYYISPQIWAWGGQRIHAIRRTVDHMIVFFHFEAQLYRKAGVPVTWVGHPLIDLAKPTQSKSEFRAKWLPKAPAENKLVALFPGSRETEVDRILPEMLRVAKRIYDRIPGTQFLLSESNTLSPELYETILMNARPTYPIRRVRNQSYDIFNASDFAMVSSGTATLEAGLASIPFVILYKTAWSTFFLGRRLIRIPYIGLVNVVAGRKIVPEFLQHEIRTETIAQEAAYLLEHQDLREKMISDLKEVRGKLGEPGAAHRAAEAVLNFLR